LRREFEEFTL